MLHSRSSVSVVVASDDVPVAFDDTCHSECGMTRGIRQATLVLLLVLGSAAHVAAQSADLSVTKTDSPDPVVSGTNLTYTITVRTTGRTPKRTSP